MRILGAGAEAGGWNQEQDATRIGRATRQGKTSEWKSVDLDDTTTQRHLDFSDGEVFGWKVSKVEVEE